MSNQKPVKSFRLSEKTLERIKYLADGLECNDTQIIEFSIRTVFNQIEHYCTVNNKKIQEISYLPILDGIKEL